MTPEQIGLVQQSFAKVAPIAPQAADIFYSRLFEVAPQVRYLFPDDMAEQKRKLMDMLGVAVNGLTRLDAILPAVQQLGRRHKGYGAVPDHYAVVGDTLIYTLDQGLGDGFTDEVRAAWAEAYGLLAGVMIEAAEGLDDD
ncbi:MAG: hypothetical protein KDE21_06555 [Novosphingobium sp.]|nr:hypothetical protein [Novosphingobium sp.]